MHSIIHLPKYTVSPAIRGRRRVVEEIVVGEIYKELTGCRMWVGCAGQRNRATRMAKTVLGFIANRFVGGFLDHAWTKSTPLDHKIWDDSVDQRAFIEARTGVGQEVLDAFRRLVVEKLKNERTKSGLYINRDRQFGPPSRS